MKISLPVSKNKSSKLQLCNRCEHLLPQTQNALAVQVCITSSGLVGSMERNIHLWGNKLPPKHTILLPLSQTWNRYKMWPCTYATPIIHTSTIQYLINSYERLPYDDLSQNAFCSPSDKTTIFPLIKICSTLRGALSMTYKPFCFALVEPHSESIN